MSRTTRVETVLTNQDELLYAITSGEYSDYKLHGLFVGPSGVDLVGLAEEWLASHPGPDYNYALCDDAFENFVVERTSLRALSYTQLHLYDSGRWGATCQTIREPK